MLARHETGVVLVAGAIPGERVRVRVEGVKRQVTFASVVEVLAPSPDRREPAFDQGCGGLVYAHIELARQRQLKAEIVADALRRLGKIETSAVIPVAASPPTGYRLRARLHVRSRRAGFFREQSHEWCDPRPGGQLLAETIHVVDDYVRHLGDAADRLEALIVAENVAARARVVHLEPGPGVRPDRSAPWTALPADLAGVTVTTSGRFDLLAGIARVTDTAADLFGSAPPIPPETSWTRSAASFFQGNRHLVGEMVRAVVEQAPGECCADLYAGVGLFAVALAARGSDVLAVEGDPMSGTDLELNAEPWPRLEVARTSVEAALVRLRPGAFETIVVDPPRTGISADALAGLVRLRADRVVYVSCDPPTLARDAGRLVASGYRLVTLRAFDLFPNTAHVETMAVFERRGVSS
jgi:tRNA/tmRNA/rRNA uracil-C5-methylase (TrmA/RlmC/RlmD family)